MNYEKLGFVDGQVLKAEHLNYMESGIKNAVETVVNPNLLDNWYFGNPVNQRGLGTYSQLNGSYSIDRWRFGNNGNVVIQDGYLAVTQDWGLWQPFEKALPHGVYTWSALMRNSTCANIRNAFGNYAADFSAEQVEAVKGTEWTLVYGTIEGALASFGFDSIGTEGYYEILAYKLELGTQQTLAHQENGVWVLNEIPDYREQLFRCQRYFQRLRTETERKTYCEDFRPTMRMTDSGEVGKGTVTENGVTYYTASADL